jgi:hypothetical protein
VEQNQCGFSLRTAVKVTVRENACVLGNIEVPFNRRGQARKAARPCPCIQRLVVAAGESRPV